MAEGIIVDVVLAVLLDVVSRMRLLVECQRQLRLQSWPQSQFGIDPFGTAFRDAGV